MTNKRDPSTKKFSRIDLAYCKDLDRVVDIQLACEAFAARSDRSITHFRFFCSDPVCRVSRIGGVKVPTVNHWRLPEEYEQYMSPHFRATEDHAKTCEWVELEEALKAEAPQPDNSSNTDNRRHPRRMQTRLITRFVIPDVNQAPRANVT